MCPGKEGRTQEWIYTESGQLQVAMSRSVGGALAKTGACRDSGADLAKVPASAPGLDILGAVLALVNALLASLGLALPLPIANAAASLLQLVRPQLPIPAQLTVLPKQMMQLAQR